MWTPFQLSKVRPMDAVFMVSDAGHDVPPPRVPHQDFQRLILAAGGADDPHRLGYAVLDTGGHGKPWGVWRPLTIS